MSAFEVKIYRLEIIPHPNADNIELAKVGDYVSIVRKGDFKTGDHAAYIPEGSIVPEAVLGDLGLIGKLSGSEKNRVKAIKLRQVVSQGLIYKSKAHWQEDQDVQEELGIKKYDPIVHAPQHMHGRHIGVAQHITINYDIENIKKYNQVFEDGEEVQITEKIHGTFAQFGYIPQRLHESYLHLGCYTVTSKGLGGRGVLLDMEDTDNVYSRIGQDPSYGLQYKLPCIKAEYRHIIGDEPIFICGEIFGPQIQRGFGYGVGVGQISFRAFDIAYGERTKVRYIDAKLLERIFKDYEIPSVPVLYRGPFSKEHLVRCTVGRETVSGKSLHIREGTVTKPVTERTDSKAGRVILKSISDAYLLGDNTEFQ
jgi:RNA ligase (TIGR02306 family)